MQNKRGQGLSTNAIILIILGVVILVVLIIGFSIGWENLAPWLSGGNVNTIVNQCQIACSTQSVYDFCIKQRDLKVSDLPPDSDGKVQKEVTNTCFFFSSYKNKDGALYGIESCSGLCPPVLVYEWVESEAVCLEGGGIISAATNCEASTTPAVCCASS